MRRPAAAGRFLRTLLLAAGAAVGVAGALAAGPARAAAQGRADSIEVRSIEFAGNTAFPDAELRASILATATRCRSSALLPLCWLGTSLDRQYYDPRVLAFDSLRVRFFYYQRGYREAQVALDTLREGAGVHVRFRIAEGRPVVVDTIRFQGGEELPATVLRRLPLQAGAAFDETLMEATRDSLRGRLQDLGYFHADVLANFDIARAAPYRASVEYQLLPGPLTRFGPVIVVGATRVDTALIVSSLAFEPGDPYSRTALLHSQRNLFALEVFRHAEINPLPTAGDSVLPVQVRVIEGYLHRFRFGLGVTTAEYLNAEFRWTGRNLLGGARRLEATARIANLVSEPLGFLPWFDDCEDIYCDLAGSLALDFSQPRFLDAVTTFGSGVFLERVTVPQVYVRTSRGAYLSLRRPLGSWGSGGIGYRPELTRLESAEQVFCVSFTACEPEDIQVLRESHRLAPVAGSWSLERANSLLAPTRGYALRLEGEVAGGATGSEFTYLRAAGEWVTYREPFRGVVVATRVRPGWARALGAPGEGLGLHPQKRFFAGGPNSVRGFVQYRLGPKLLAVDAARELARPVSQGGAGCSPQAINAGECDITALLASDSADIRVQPIGGTALLEGNVEMRFPLLLERLRGAAFLDFGQVWRGTSEVNVRELAWSPGVGIRYFSPIGPVRVDVGYNALGPERLTVLSTDVCNDVPAGACGPIEPGQTYERLANGTRLRAQRSVTYDPFDSFLDRLQIHFSIGQAF